MYRMSGLASAGPVRIILTDESLTPPRYLILIGQPRHIQDHDPSVLLQYAVEFRRHLLMIKIPEALAGRDHIEAVGREIDLLGRYRPEFDVHSGLICKSLCLSDLLRRDIGPDPVCSVLIHITRKDACTRTKVQDSLALYAKTSVCHSLIEFVRIYIPVSGVVFRCLTPVKSLACIYPVIFDLHINYPSSFSRYTNTSSSSTARWSNIS